MQFTINLAFVESESRSQKTRLLYSFQSLNNEFNITFLKINRTKFIL